MAMGPENKMNKQQLWEALHKDYSGEIIVVTAIDANYFKVGEILAVDDDFSTTYIVTEVFDNKIRVQKQ